MEWAVNVWTCSTAWNTFIWATFFPRTIYLRYEFILTFWWDMKKEATCKIYDVWIVAQGFCDFSLINCSWYRVYSVSWTVKALCVCSQCFFCNTEDEFDLLCHLIQKRLVHPEKQPLFELCNERPRHWSPLEDGAEEALGASAFMGTCIRPQIYMLLNLRVKVRTECISASALHLWCLVELEIIVSILT